MAFTPQAITKELDMANLAKHNANYAGIKTELDTQAAAAAAHTAAQSAHGSTPAADAGKIVQRDSAGRAKVAAPVAADDIARKAEVDAVQDALDDHEADSVVHLSAKDRTKFDGIKPEAEPNQNAFARVNNVEAAAVSDTITIAGGTGITVTTNPTTKTVTVTATGDATPGAHGDSHVTGGSDPIPLATDTTSGLMSPETVQSIEDLANPPRANYSSDVEVELPNFVWISPKWNKMILDTNSFVNQTDNTKVNITKSGTYLIQAMVIFDQSEVGSRNVRIMKNDGQEQVAYNSNHGGFAAIRANVAAVTYLNAGENISIVGYQDDYPNVRKILGGTLSIIRLCPPWRSKSYGSRLYVPTQVIKLNNKYFIVDSGHHRIIWSNDINAPIEAWKTIDYEFAGCHSIASDGDIYVVDNAGLNDLIVFDSNLRFKQKLINVGGRPHKTVYDPQTDAFYVVSAPYIFCYKKISGQLTLHYQKTPHFLAGNYVRSIKIIDGQMYFVSGNAHINVANHVDESYDLIASYPVPSDMVGMVDIEKAGGYFYITSLQNANQEIKPTAVRIADLSKLMNGEAENIYSTLELDKPYFFEINDGRVYLTNVGDDVTKIISFLPDMTDVQVHHEFRGHTADDIKRRDMYPL